ncbi:MAG: UDP-N-acetylglucosamine 2-epimerase (non-hydrolyzing) [Myxococcales bacterium]|jgi:UDP-N-acetylglucosamine 2-epimerase (non-hydrolysing)|nr:UDP-N-acetylglucosamine 2-epimerase (non-hydrolyzing) [Myxococcales bacterium]
MNEDEVNADRAQSERAASTRLKVMTILGTRPEIIRLSACLKRCDEVFDHVLVHTGQNYDYALNQVFFEELGLRPPDHYLNCVGQNLGESLGNILAKSFAVLEAERPDALLILGDTNSALSAIVAKRLKIPIFHMEAGNRCWDWNVPEMINRKIVDHISDINLPYTEHARRYLLSEGLDGKTIFVTGSPMREVLEAHLPKIRERDILDRLGLTPRRYFLVSAHREENIDHEGHFLSLMTAINEVAARHGLPVLYSAHPRTQKFIQARGFRFHPNVVLHAPLGFLDYVKLQMESQCVLSDSGTLSEESAILGFCGVLIRTSTERPEALDAGSVVMGGIDPAHVLQAIDLAVALRSAEAAWRIPPDYAETNVSAKVVRIIQSYADVVRKTVWNQF